MTEEVNNPESVKVTTTTTHRSNSPIAIWRRLYNGDTNFDFIGRRKWLYLASAVATLVAIGGIIFSPFNLGIEFVGGNQFQAHYVAGHDLDQVEEVVRGTGVDIASTQMAGSDAAQRYIIRTAALSDTESAAVQDALSDELGISVDQVTVSEVSSSWGSSVSVKAIQALIVFLVLVCAYLWFRYDRAMAGASIIGLLQNLVFTAGIYALVGFEVTPNTIIGLLTIKGYSLYDNVVVFDKVHENTRGVLKQRDFTYAEGTNRAINQTLMRSINTSLIGLLPVAGLLFVGAGLLGVGTLTDLSLVLFVGIATGTLASLFLSSPLLVDFTNMNAAYKNHTARVLARRASGKRGDKGAESRPQWAEDVDDDTEEFGEDAPADEDDEARTVTSGASAAPRPGIRTTTARKKRKRR